MLDVRRYRLKMARVAFLVVFVIVCAVSVASSPTEREISEKQVGYRHDMGWKFTRQGKKLLGFIDSQ